MTLYVDFALTSLTINDASVPEPASLALLGAGALMLTTQRRRTAHHCTGCFS